MWVRILTIEAGDSENGGLGVHEAEIDDEGNA